MTEMSQLKTQLWTIFLLDYDINYLSD